VTRPLLTRDVRIIDTTLRDGSHAMAHQFTVTQVRDTVRAVAVVHRPEGRRGATGFAVASAVGGAAQNFTMLVTARAAQGAFATVLAPAALSLLSTTFPHPDERGKAFGIYSGIATAGASVGLLVGGALTQYLTWRWTMYVNVAIAGVVIVAGPLLLTSPPAQARQRVDRVGAALGGLGLFAVVYGFAHASVKAGGAGWTDPQTIGSIAAGVVLLVAFVIAERRVAYPLLPVRVVLDRNRGASYTATLMASVGLFAVFLFFTYYLETILGYSPVRTGLAFLPLTIAVLVGAGVVGSVLLPRVSPRLLVPPGLLLAAAGMALLARIGLHTSYAWPALPALILIGLGLGVVFAPCFSLGTSGVSDEDAGVASAAINVSTQIGASIGTALLNTIATAAAASFITAHAVGAAPSPALVAQAAVHSYAIAFWVGAAVMAAAALIVAPLLRPGLAELGASEDTPAPLTPPALCATRTASTQPTPACFPPLAVECLVATVGIARSPRFGTGEAVLGGLAEGRD
jgi:MFS family permease